MDAPKKMIDLRTAGAVKQPVQLAQAADSLVPREMPFTVRYRGQEAVVISVGCLGVDDKARMARIEADMAGGRLWDLLPPDRQSYLRAFATVAVQVRGTGKDGEMPDWLNKALQEDDALLGALYDKACAHRALFFGADVGAGQGDSSEPRFLIHAPMLDAAAARDDKPDAPSAG